MRSLTGNVVRKQSQIEALMSEKNSLAMQVEEMERRSRAETRIPMPRQIPRSRDDELSGEGGRVRTLKSIFGESSESSGHLQQTVRSTLPSTHHTGHHVSVHSRLYASDPLHRLVGYLLTCYPPAAHPPRLCSPPITNNVFIS